MRRLAIHLASLCLLASATTAHAQHDLSGRWLTSGTTKFFGQTEPFTNQHWDVVQSAGTLTVTFSNESGMSAGPFDGTINESTGAFHIDLPVLPPGQSGSVDGTVAADSRSFTATGVTYTCAPSLTCIPHDQTYLGSRCGNGQPDAGEQCDDDNASAGDCCSPSCMLDGTGTACTSDDNVCTDDVCDGAGTCAHAANSAPCVSESGCSAGTCASSACVPTSPLPAGSSCDLDSDLCSADTCDGAGACTAGGPFDCEPCGVCDPGYGCVAGPDHFDGCEDEPGSIRLKVDAGSEAKRGVTLDIDERNAFYIFRTEDFGDPTTDTDYSLCVYDERPGEPMRVLFGASISAGGTCDDRPCWTRRESNGGKVTFRYRNRALTPNGISSIKLERFGGITLKGKGANLGIPAELPVDGGTLTPLVIADGPTRHCWSHSVGASKLTTTRFKGSYSPVP